jgi:hypothetical protein
MELSRRVSNSATALLSVAARFQDHADDGVWPHEVKGKLTGGHGVRLLPREFQAVVRPPWSAGPEVDAHDDVGTAPTMTHGDSREAHGNSPLRRWISGMVASVIRLVDMGPSSFRYGTDLLLGGRGKSKERTPKVSNSSGRARRMPLSPALRALMRGCRQLPCRTC